MCFSHKVCVCVCVISMRRHTKVRADGEKQLLSTSRYLLFCIMYCVSWVLHCYQIPIHAV